MSGRKKLGILISGRGSNMEAIVAATQNESYPARVEVVISDNREAAGLETAKSNRIKTVAIERRSGASRQDHEAAIVKALDGAGIDLICLAGYMRILSKAFTERYEGRLINIHPSLLPEYKGLDTHARVIADKGTTHGCTVHIVNDEMDGGTILAQTSVPVFEDDTETILAGRVLAQEHKLYQKVIREIFEGRFAHLGMVTDG
ncbi:MAG: phosphoribosylglycinamide formyltransferase [Pseudomonadota bacterium]